MIFFVCIVIICILFSSDEPKCESSQVKDMVIEIFKQKNPFCINNSDSITSVTLENPIADSYDSSINKYSCKGTVIVKSSNR